MIYDATPIIDGRTCWQKPEEVINVNTNKGEKKMTLKDYIEKEIKGKVNSIIEEMNIASIIEDAIDDIVSEDDVWDEARSQVQYMCENADTSIESAVEDALDYYDYSDEIEDAFTEAVRSCIRGMSKDAIEDAIDDYIENYEI